VNEQNSSLFWRRFLVLMAEDVKKKLTSLQIHREKVGSGQSAVSSKGLAHFHPRVWRPPPP
jgi:hypothetical protein